MLDIVFAFIGILLVCAFGALIGVVLGLPFALFNKVRGGRFGVGRWTLLARTPGAALDPEFVFDRLLARYGVLFRRLLLREKQPLPWRELVRVGRLRELRGEVRGGRFVQGFAGEQFAHPDAVPLLRAARREDAGAPLEVPAADPLNLCGILTPGARVSPLARARVSLLAASSRV